MIFLFASLLVGMVLGSFAPISVPLGSVKYFSVALLAGVDSLLGAGKAVFEGRFNLSLFVSGFITNTLLAGFLTYAGDRLGVELYLAAVITFGVRIFQDLSIMRVYIFKRFSTDGPQGDSQAKSETSAYGTRSH